MFGRRRRTVRGPIHSAGIRGLFGCVGLGRQCTCEQSTRHPAADNLGVLASDLCECYLNLRLTRLHAKWCIDYVGRINDR